MKNRIFLAVALAAACRLVRAEAPAAPQAGASAAPANAQAGQALAGGGSAMYAFLKPARRPGVPATCLAAQRDGLVKLPLFGATASACPVAAVSDGVVTLRELTEVLAMAHGGGATHGKPRDMDFTPALDRLIASRLIIAEARTMGLEDLPESRKDLEDYKASALRVVLQQQASRRAKADPAVVDTIYRDMIRSWKLRSILFQQEDDAKKFRDEVKAGKSFAELAKQAVAGKHARGGAEETVAPRAALPQIAAAVNALKPGGVSDPVHVPGGWVILRLEAVVYPDDAGAKTAAKERALIIAGQKAVRSFYEALVKKYATVDQKLLKELDFEAPKPGFEALLKDSRVLASIQGEKPLTVADLTAKVAEKFFHGMESPIKEKRVNVEKMNAWESLLGTRLFAKEAAARKLADSPEYRAAVEEHRRNVCFGTFIEKVIVPGLKLTEGDAQRYYEQHKADYTSPQMYRLDGIAFGDAKVAQAALDKLKAGTDLGWMRTNAEGQLPPEARTLALEGALISVRTMPPELARALTGARTGDYRLYVAGAQHYVVHVAEDRPPATRPYAEVREDIAKKLHDDAVRDAVQEYAVKLRAAQPVEVFLARIGS